MLWAVSLSTMELIPHSLTAALSLTGIRSLAKVSNPVGPIAYPVLYLRQETHDAAPMHFGENQLSRSLIGLSPLTTGHPPGFQPWWVRSSTKSYLRFNLPMARSLRFGSWACDWTALFGLAFATAPPHGLTSPHTANSQAHSSKGTQSRRRVQVLDATLPRLVGTRFQVLFHSAPAVLFTIPSRYYPLSVTREYLGLAGGPARFTRDFSGPVLLGCLSNEPLTFRLRGSYPLRRTFRMSFAYINGF